MWLVMIILHTAAGVAAFVVGIAALRAERLRRHLWLLPLLLWLLVATVVFVAGAVAAHWSDLSGVAQLTFCGLVGLGLYMLRRARSAVPAGGGPATARSMDDIGFTLISLFDGFIIVTALDLGAPPWVVAPVAALAVVIGHRAIARAKRNAAPLPLAP